MEMIYAIDIKDKIFYGTTYQPIFFFLYQEACGMKNHHLTNGNMIFQSQVEILEKWDKFH
jgi:hypothetical protein